MPRPDVLVHDNVQQPNKNNVQKKHWLDLQYDDTNRKMIKKPNEYEHRTVPSSYSTNEKIANQIKGSMFGMAIGDALGAHVEFRPHDYLTEYPVLDLEGGGTWGLQKGQFTDDTSMALCLANSLVAKCDFNLYDQLVRYKWWYEEGYMSSTGECFDIGNATRNSLEVFKNRQEKFAKENNLSLKEIDNLSDEKVKQFNVYCSSDGVAGNGALMRLAPVPLFFYRFPQYAVQYSGLSGLTTHGDRKVYDACRYYGALIFAALHGYTKEQLLDKEFYSKHMDWFENIPLCDEIRIIAEGSYQKKGGYDDGVRGKGYIVDALEAALWAFWSDRGSFETGALAAVNLGDDTDTTAAIYGQLAGAFYGYNNLPRHWVQYIYAENFIINLCEWITYESEVWQPSENSSLMKSSQPFRSQSSETNTEITKHIQNPPIQPTKRNDPTSISRLDENNRHEKDQRNQNSIEHHETDIMSGENSLETSTMQILGNENKDHNDAESHIVPQAHHNEKVKNRNMKTKSQNNPISTCLPKSDRSTKPPTNKTSSMQNKLISDTSKKTHITNNSSNSEQRIHRPRLVDKFQNLLKIPSNHVRTRTASGRKTEQIKSQSAHDVSYDNSTQNNWQQRETSPPKRKHYRQRVRSALGKTKSKS